MSTRLLAVIAAVALLAVSCGLLDSPKEVSLDPLIRAADGTLYAPACLAAVGQARKAECVVDTSGKGSRSSRTSPVASWIEPYYEYFQQNGYYSYVDPYFYAPQTFCGRWGWSSNCFDWFGYGNWNFPSQGYCDECLYAVNLPNASQPAPTSTSNGAPYCPSYCSSWWYPSPWQPTTDACQGLAGTYTGMCWNSSSATFATQITLTVASTNGACQVSGTGYGAARVTVRAGAGSAALIGTTAGSAAFADFYGSSYFNVAGFDGTTNSWFRCSSANSYQPWYY